jgi:hypothetical protein
MAVWGTGWFFRFPALANAMAVEPLPRPRRIDLFSDMSRMLRRNKCAKMLDIRRK